MANDPTRRQLLGTTAALLAATTVSPTRAATDASPPVPASFLDNHALRPLRFDAAKLEGLSQRLIESHWQNNYGGSVRTLNAVKARLAAASNEPDVPAFVYNGLKREHLMRTGSVVLHELYFDGLGGNGRADSRMRTLIANSFGSFDAWETEFRRIAAGLGGGCGWVVLAHNAHLGTLENYWLADHMHFPAGGTPLLVLDMYEHSYQMDYGAAAAKYVDAAFDNFDWEMVAARAATIAVAAT
jgi:Fe-Mn family superoxide dismutase